MGLPGVYVGRKTAALLVLVLAALLLLLGALGALYGLCRRRGAAPAPPAPGPTEPAQTPAPTSAPGPTRPPGPWSGARLPRSLRPLHYELELWPRARPGLPGAPPAFTGRVNITVRCSRDTAAAVLHSAGLRYEPPPAVRGPRGPVEVARLWLEERRQYAVLELRQALRAGGRYVLQLAFQGALDEDPHGLFLTRYTDRGRPSMLIASQLEPTYARTVFPCFDEPDMKATFNIRIVHDPSYVALSNMPAIGVSEMKDENGSIWTVTTFDTTPKMSTYITAFVVCDFDHMTVTERGKEIRIWARKEAVEKGCVDYALNITGPIFSFLEDLFNISYPLPKTDLVALPDFGAGAMENWGLMTFQESSLIYCPAENLINRKAFVSLIVSHEIGHQWFGNLVTMSWWNDLWLNEGFASYFEYVGAKYVEPKPPLDHMFYESVLQPVLRAEDAMSDRSLSQKEEKVKGTFIFDSLFDIVTYNKGASVIWMLSSFLTERLFLKALNSYLKAFSFSSANQDDLWTHIQMIIDAQNEVQLPASVKNIMDPWTCQDGFPVLTFDPSTGTISQEQFHNIRKKENTTSYNNTWIVPISWVRNGSSQPIVWLDETSKIFPEMQISGSEHDWILLNMNLSGYYRVNYNSSYLKRIGKLLENNPEVFPLVNRLQLIDDAFSLTESGYLEIESALDLTKYLAKENDIFVWYIVLSNLMPNDLECTLKDYEIYPLLKKYLIKKMLPVYHYYAGIIRQNADVLADNYFAEAYLEQLLRKACWLGLQDCLDLCSELYAKWMENPKNQIPAFVRRTIFCYGIAMGSDKEWEFAWEMYHHDNSTTHDKDILLYAMGCTRESWLLHRYMQSGINGSLFSSNNTIFLIYNLAASDTGLRIIWKFMTENWPLLQERFGNAPLHAVLNGMKRLVNTDLQIQELQLFYNATLEENESISTTTRLQSAKLENKERAKLIARVTDWLQKNIDD